MTELAEDVLTAIEHEVRARGAVLLVGFDGGLHIVPKRSKVPRWLRLRVYRYRSEFLRVLRTLKE